MSESDLDSALKMRHWEAAFLILVHLDEEELWERAGQAAIKCLETSSAALFYRHIQQVYIKGRRHIAAVFLGYLNFKNEF